MNGRLASNEALLDSMLPALPAGVDVALCVPFPYLAQLAVKLGGSAVGLGAQDISEHTDGAFTGQVSAGMLADFGCAYAIVGHSERRSLLGEPDAAVAAKAARALAAGITPIVCIGETLEQRERGEVAEVLLRQLDALDVALPASDIGRVVLAYEPVWAIGTGRVATPEQVADVLALVRRWVEQRTGDVPRTRILYGGSVKADSAGWLFALDDADGVLVGGASLLADEFVAICRAAAGRSI
ncbi:MAG: triose-phosphate isomerase [Pseudazoarcus pumilus]|nr:triose-phosphate isomerase [Pseudazoarcus pumilus]